jgi:hypothetical protein
MKRCQKIKRRQRAHLGSIGSKHDTVRRCDDVDRRRYGTDEEREEMMPIGPTRLLLEKNEENTYGQFSCYK